MKSLTYTAIAFLAYIYVFKSYGLLATLLFTLVLLAIICWFRRATILTHLASRAYFINGDVQKGEKFYKLAYKTGEMNTSCKLSYSSFCLRENNHEKARRLLNEIINSKKSATPDKINAKHNLAVLTWKEGDLDGAVKMLEILHKEMPATNSYGTLGVLYLEKAKRDKNFEEYLPFMKEAYDYNSSDKTIADNLGELYYNLGEYDKAKEVYDELLTKELFTPMPYYNYALVLKALGDIDGARKYFDKALSCRFTSVLTITREMIQAELDSLN